MRSYLPLALAALGAGNLSHAAILSTVINNGGTWTYQYTVDNSAGGFDVATWSLDLPIAPDWNPLDVAGGGDVTVPSADWLAQAGLPVAGIAAQDFLSFPGAEVPAGLMLRGFAFTSAYPPGDVTYYEFDANGTASGSGTTRGPIPEPGSLGLAATLGLLAWGAVRRARSSGAPRLADTQPQE